MRDNHRNIEFDVHRVDGKRYQWTIHPMMRQGICVVGTVEGDEEKATATARAEIDARLGERERESVSTIRLGGNLCLGPRLCRTLLSR